MRTLLTLLLLLPLTVQGQALWRNWFTTNQNPRLTVVAGSNATVQASTVGVDQRIFTVNAVPGNTGNSTNFWGVLSPTNLPPGLSTSNYVGTFTGNGAGLTNLSQGAYTGTVTNTINSTNVTLTGPLQIYGTSARTNGIYIDSSGEVLSNASGGVTIAGGNISATGSVVATNSAGTNALLGAVYLGANYTNMAIYADTNALQFRNTRANGTNIFYVDPATGAILWNADNKYDIGANEANRPGKLYLGGGIVNSGDYAAVNGGAEFQWFGRTRFDVSNGTGNVDGNFRIRSNVGYTKFLINNAPTALTSSSAISVFRVNSITNSIVGGVFDYTIACTDDTENQTVSGIVTFAAVNTNGVWYSKVATENANNQAKALTSGTLTTSWGVIDDPTSGCGTTNVVVQVTATTSLTPAAGKFNIIWQLRNNSTNIVSAL